MFRESLAAIHPLQRFSGFFVIAFLLILSLCSIFINGGNVGWTAETSDIILKVDMLRMIVAKFGSI